MPSHGTARSVANKILGIGLSTGKNLISQGTKPKGRSRYGLNTEDRNSTALSAMGMTPRSAKPAAAKQLAPKTMPANKTKAVDAFSNAKQRGSSGDVNQAHLGKIRVVKKEYEQHREAKERLRTMTDTKLSNGSTLKTGVVGLNSRKLRDKGIEEGLGKIKRKKLSPSAVKDREAVFWDKLHATKSLSGITEFMKGKGTWRRLKRNIQVGWGRNFQHRSTAKANNDFKRNHKRDYMKEFNDGANKIKTEMMSGIHKTLLQHRDRMAGTQKLHEEKSDSNTIYHSLSGIVDFIKSYRKTKALKGARRRLSARVSSHTYKQTAPAVKRSAKAKLRNTPKKAKKPTGAGANTKKSRNNRGAIDKQGRRKYRPDTEYDRGLTMNENDDNYGMDECEEMNFAPFEPERARGYYARGRKPGRHTPNASTDTF